MWNSWQFYAILSALFASLTAILAKVGVRDVDSNVATAIRTTVILGLTWGIVLMAGGAERWRGLSMHSLFFLILSGIATGASWLFYFRALKLGDASRVAPVDKLSVVLTILLGVVVLGEPLSWKVMAGGGLILAGSLLLLI